VRILFLAPYPLKKAPSQRFRFEHFLKSVEQAGWEWDFQSFTSERGWKNLYSNPTPIHNLMTLVSGTLRRVKILFRVDTYQVIFIHRELTPFGPPVFEWILTKALRKKVIYDFDDAIWMYDGHDENLIWTWLKWRSKIKSICKWSWKISAGNEFLADFARRCNDNVVVVPTVVDTDVHKPQVTPSNDEILRFATDDGKIIIGWTGSHSTMFYLKEVIPVLKELEKNFDFEFHVISNQDPEPDLKSYRFIKWKEESEIEDLAKFNIGIMPLPDTEWAKGKCGFKLIQYGAMGIPSIASPVGINKEIIEEGESGFLVREKKEWIEQLTLLINDENLRIEMGENAKKYITKNYSAKSIKSRFLTLFS